METLIVVLASTSCLLFGFAAATHLGSRARKLLAERLEAETRDVIKSSKSELGSLKNEVKALKASNSKGKSKGSQKETEKLKKELKSSKSKHSSERSDLEKKLSGAEAELAKAKAAEVAANAISAGGDTTELSAALEKAGKGLNDILAALVSDQEQKAALLSDSTGIVIASSGDPDTIDGTAAAASALTGIPKQLENLLPLDQHFTYRLEDGTNSIVGEALESDGELIAFTTIGSRPPSKNAMKVTLASLIAALE